MSKPAIVVATRGDFLGWRVVGAFNTLNEAQDHVLKIGKPGEFTVFMPIMTVTLKEAHDTEAAERVPQS